MDPRRLDKGQKLKIGQSRLNIHGTNLKGKSIGSEFFKKELKGEPRSKSRIQFASNESKLVPKTLGPI